MHTTVIQRIASAYGLARSRVSAPQKGYRNEAYALGTGSQTLNLILYKREPGMAERVKRANRVADFAAATLPARKTYSPRIITLSHGAYTNSYTKYGALYHYLPGHTIPWEAYTQTHIKLLGLGLSHLHAALEALHQDNLPDVEDDQLATLEHMEHYFANHGVRTAMAAKLGLKPPKLQPYRNLFAATRRLPDRQPLHMDFVRGNVLFAPASQTDRLQLDTIAISGILDFEKTAHGPRWYDIARSYAFMLVDCKYKTPGQVHKYFLYSGYRKRGGFTLPLQRALLEPLVDFFLLHDLYKFLRHNPYESLVRNEHFIRTRDILKQRGVL